MRPPEVRGGRDVPIGVPSNMIQYAAHYYPGLTVRPLALKVDQKSAVHFLEFNVASRPGDLRIVRSASYSINTSEAQIAMIRATSVPKQ